MKNFDLRKYLTENKLTTNNKVEEAYTWETDDRMWELNDDQETTDTLNAIVEKYGLENVIQWLEGGK